MHDSPLTQEIKEMNRTGPECVKKDHKEVADLLECNRQKQIDQCKKENKNRTERYKIGDLVLVRMQLSSTGESRKLQTKYKGPYIIVKVLDKERYIVEDIEEERQGGKPYKNILASNRLKLVTRNE